MQHRNRDSKTSKLRIPRGRLKGRWVTFSDEGAVRPTLGRVREAVLSMIAPFSRTHTFVDLFSGSGVMGFCACSLDFPQVVMLDCDAGVCRQLRENAQHLGVEPTILCRHADTMESLLVRAPILVYADPPFSQPEAIHGVTHGLARWPAFDQRSMAVMETDRRVEIPLPEGLVPDGERKYGRIKITFFGRDHSHRDGFELK